MEQSFTPNTPGRVKHNGSRGRLSKRTVNLKGNRVVARYYTTCRQNDVELGKHCRIMNRDRLGGGIIVLVQIESGNRTSVEVSNHSSGIANTHVQHLIHGGVGNLNRSSQIHGHRLRVANARSLHSFPRRVVKAVFVPSIRNVALATVELPVVVFDLEGKQGTEVGETEGTPDFT